MKRITFSLLLIASLVLLSGTVLSQDMSEGDMVYPFQYAGLDAYTAATGNSIASYGEAPMLTELVAVWRIAPR